MRVGENEKKVIPREAVTENINEKGDIAAAIPAPAAMKLPLAPSSTPSRWSQPAAMKLLLDECLRRKFKHPLPGHECRHSLLSMGFDGET